MDLNADAVLSFPEALAFLDGTLERPLSNEEAAQIIGTPGTADRIHFNIPGAGPHILALPEGGLRIRRAGLAVDGYTQPGASPATLPAAAANDALLKIAVDARNGNHTGQPGESEGAILVMEADGVSLRGLSFLSSRLVTNYGIGWRQGASGGRISGCWIGLHPDGITVSGGETGVSAFETGGGHLVGTEADGLNDASERNIIVGHNVETIFEDSTDCRISGNFIGVMPDGLSLIPAEAEAQRGEGDAVEGGNLDRLIVGSPASGPVQDAAMNVIGGMKDEVVQFYYGSNPGIVIRGNRIGTGIDGVTPLPNRKFYNPSRATVSITDNVLAHHSGTLLNMSGNVVFQQNRMRGNATLFSGTDQSFQAMALGGGLDPIPVVDPVLTNLGRLVVDLPLAGLPDLTAAEVDLYWSDAETAAVQPQGVWHLGQFTDNSPADNNPTAGVLDVSLAQLPMPQLGPGVLLVTSTVRSTASADGGTSPFSAPVLFPLPAPVLRLEPSGPNLLLTWSDSGWVLESSPTMNRGTWRPVSGISPLAFPQATLREFYRLRLP